MSTDLIKSPFSYFGSKRQIASLIWQGLGTVSNYIEPFAGSLSVLLANPSIPKIETVNDINCFLANFWRAVSKDPKGVAQFADYPVNETDLHARHNWLVSAATEDFVKKMDTDPDHYDLKIAGWWVWGMGASIGNNWMQPKGLNATPMLSSAGGGIHGMSNNILDWFTKIQERTRRVRVCSGDWKRIVTPSITYNSKGLSSKDMTAVFLDPPYDLNKRSKVYKDDSNIYSEVCDWAFSNGDNPRMRIALCGYEGDTVPPIGWQVYQWKNNGGLGNMGDGQGRVNAAREVIYFSPYCEKI
jgi:DNA adenine methylase